jgi:hypothetical protein
MSDALTAEEGDALGAIAAAEYECGGVAVAIECKPRAAGPEMVDGPESGFAAQLVEAVDGIKEKDHKGVRAVRDDEARIALIRHRLLPILGLGWADLVRLGDVAVEVGPLGRGSGGRGRW